jgi:N-acetylmuramoyl-L-alanine amidase
MIRKAFLGGVAGGLLTLAVLPTATAAELRSIQLSAAPESAVMTLRLTDGPAAKVFTLDGPDRAVIDLPDTHARRGMAVPAATGLVSAVRLGHQPHGTLRIVLELKSGVAVKTSQAASPSGRELTVTLGEPAAAVAAAAPVDTGPKVVRAAHAPGDGDRDVIIAVDAGHGGVDPGAIGHGGTREKDVTLAIARDLATRIDSEPGMHAVLTRDRDEFLELRDRIQRAHAAHADMFLSIHADSIPDRSISGASVYILSVHGASSEAARELAEGQNAVDLMGGVLADAGAAASVVLDLAQQESIGLSATAAERVVSALEHVGEVRKAQVQRAGFVVLKSPGIPSMLIETAYISNPAEERRLRSPDQQSRLADAICGGVRAYFVANPPDGTRFKQERRVASAAEVAAAGGGTPAPAPLSQ